MFRRKKRLSSRAIAADVPAEQTAPGTPHRSPAWLNDATASSLLGQGMPAGLLGLHHRLVLAAEQGFGRVQYLEAARIVKSLLTDITMRPVRENRIDVTVMVRAAVEEILTVLRTWDPSTSPEHVRERFDLADAWESHVDGEVQTAIRLALTPAAAAPSPSFSI